MRAFRGVLVYIISLVLMAVLLLLQVGIFMQMVFANPKFYVDRLEKVDYYGELRKEIDFELLNMSRRTSIPVDVLTDSVKDDAIIQLNKYNIYAAASYMSDKTEFVKHSMDVRAIEPSLDRFIEDYGKENQIEIDQTQRELIKEVAVDVGQVVTNYAILFNIDAVKKFNEFQRFRSLVYLFSKYWYMMVLVFIMCIASLAVLNIRSLRKVLLWSGSSMIAASLMALIPAGLALLYKIPYRLNIATISLEAAVRSFTLGYIQYFLYTGGLLLLMGVISLLIYGSERIGIEKKVTAAGL